MQWQSGKVSVLRSGLPSGITLTTEGNSWSAIVYDHTRLGSMRTYSIPEIHPLGSLLGVRALDGTLNPKP